MESSLEGLFVREAFTSLGKKRRTHHCPAFRDSLAHIASRLSAVYKVVLNQNSHLAYLSSADLAVPVHRLTEEQLFDVQST